ncbi:hypothetical protein DYB32_004068 [Aphanomyces invadans]|uniref:Uncharacterized protein n=1 Tax=Aphanomyces invadans TaxID=157072 RepID=A0A3R6ZRI3_9STRA|nr:hypothetical protein DYB32_004068 [Aphanomyces invadans]
MLEHSQTQLTQTTSTALEDVREQLRAIRQSVHLVEGRISVPTQPARSLAVETTNQLELTRAGQVEEQFELLEKQAVKLSAQLKELETMTLMTGTPDAVERVVPANVDLRYAPSDIKGWGLNDTVTPLPYHEYGSTDAQNMDHDESSSTVARLSEPSPMDSKKLDLRLKRELSKARFEQVARRQKERLRRRVPSLPALT